MSKFDKIKLQHIFQSKVLVKKSLKTDVMKNKARVYLLDQRISGGRNI